MGSSSGFPPSQLIVMNIPDKFDLLIFDLDGVLLDFYAAEAFALQSAFEQAGIPFQEHWLEQYRSVNTVFWQAFERGEVTPAQIKQERFPVFLSEIGVKVDPVAMGRNYLAGLSRCSELLGDPIPVLDRLKGSIPMALITNGLMSVQHPRLDASGLRPYFSPIVISEEVGLAKPDPAIFELALSPHRIRNRARVLMVGDSLSSDIAGAHAGGIEGCWFNPHRKPLPGHVPAPAYEIRDLRQLLSL